jgi:NAD-dependent DNA ligase
MARSLVHFLANLQTSSMSSKTSPLAKGSPPPQAVVGFLDGTHFVFSGVLPSMSREAAEDLVKGHGGKVGGHNKSRTKKQNRTEQKREGEESW